MIKFNNKELDYIEESMENVLDIWNNGTKEELKQYIKDIGGKELDTVLLAHNNDWFSIDLINTNTYINKEIKDFCLNALGMWVFIDLVDTIEELMEYIPDEMYCCIYKKIVNDDGIDI